MSAEVTCPANGQPTAKVTAPAKLTVLGQSVTVGLNSPTHVDVPAIGSVDVEFSKKTVTSSTAAASALEVQVAVNPLNLNVAKVNGKVTVASVSCEKPVPAAVPAAATSPAPSGPAGSASPTAQNRTAPKESGEELAYTGSSGSTALAAGGFTLLLAGGAAVWMTRRRRAAHARHR
ncbi:LPXTG cell wall anchor domain-containing protein [Kitasatospora cheerisanensis]|nr:LPXTG cell wall anchor domain-containing protein [Kitasatospora cheerisanensis]